MCVQRKNQRHIQNKPIDESNTYTHVQQKENIIMLEQKYVYHSMYAMCLPDDCGAHRRTIEIAALSLYRPAPKNERTPAILSVPFSSCRSTAAPAASSASTADAPPFFAARARAPAQRERPRQRARVQKCRMVNPNR
jgi:hypothetical protein